MINAKFPKKLRFLFSPKRYKIARGGRGSGKSWAFARALLILGAQRQLRILCAREVQKSIKQSVHALLSDQIVALGLGAFYEILDNEIRGINGTEFSFSGLASHTVDSVKSFEGADIVWIEEAQSVSKYSWDILIPTIRKPGSEIWVSMNPKLKTDDTYKRFVLEAQNDPDAISIEINYYDNPWFPEELEKERLKCQRDRPDDYDNIWLGKVKEIADGAIYAAELKAAAAGQRICSVPYDPILPVTTIWDLGVSDSTSIWFVQQAGREIRVIDYYEATGEGLPHYANELNKRGYVYKTHFAPHDIAVRELGSGRSRIETAATLGIKFEITPNIPVEDGIHAARMIFPRCWFDEKKTERGLECLRSYRREYNDKMGEFKATPVHDWASHASDAFRYVAVALQDEREKREKKPARSASGSAGWMRG